MRSLFFTLLLTLLLITSIVFSQTATTPEIKTGDNLNYAERQEWHNILDWPQSYEDSFVTTYNSTNPDDYGGIRFYALPDDWYLAEIQTFRGAYQGGTFFMLYQQRWQEGFLVSFPSARVRNDGSYRVSSQIEVGGFTSFEEDTKELEIFSRARGVGGCGSLSRYKFEHEFAYLISIHAQSCEEADAQGEDMILSPDEWPLVWPPQ